MKSTIISFSVITVDVMDVSSEAQDNINDDSYRLRLDADGRNISESAQKIEINQNKTIADPTALTQEVKCGSCYGAAADGM